MKKYQMTPEEIEYIVNRAIEIGAGESMRKDEAERGFKVMCVDDEPWLSSDDWNKDIVISVDGHKVRIVALMAKVIGTGAFTRLVEGIIDAGKVPVVVCPFARMETILIRWNWRKGPKDMATGEIQWWPQKEFKQRRKELMKRELGYAIARAQATNPTSTTSGYFSTTYPVAGVMSTTTTTAPDPYYPSPIVKYSGI